MKKFMLAAGILSFAAMSLFAGDEKPGHAGANSHLNVRPESVQWEPAPPSLPPGAQMAVLLGNPGKTGPYVLRAKLPDSYRVPPHWHPTDENVTVLQGTFLIGEGDDFDASRLESLPAGSFVHMPKTMRHFAMAKGETIVQLHGNGPFQINYVHPADDPRGKGAGK